jgi:hypothetical protein
MKSEFTVKRSEQSGSISHLQHKRDHKKREPSGSARLQYFMKPLYKARVYTWRINNRKIVESRNLAEQFRFLHTCSKQGCMQQPHPHAELPWSDPSTSIYTHLFDSPLDAKIIYRILKYKISSTWETNPRSKRTIAMGGGAAIGIGKTLVQCDVLKIGSLMKLSS